MSPKKTEGMPDVFGYLDYRQFLQDWFDARKANNPRFSHRLFARQAGLRSPALLSNVIKRRRNLTVDTIDSFVRAMKLTATQATFFSHLVHFDQASSDARRNEVWKKISATRRFREARRIEGDSVEYLSKWYHSAVREMATRKGFRADYDWVAKKLCPRITGPQARKALELLFRLGLLVEKDDGTATAMDASLVTPDEVVGMAVHNYHQGMLERSCEAITGFRPKERHFGALTVAIPESMVAQLKEEITSFQARILDICDLAPEKERIYQLNVQLFPLSANLDE
ncbi:MAG: TIGR02147 family protein [Proteobacteria bacterium]|nr:TIGR02147 family protein [Pseudomonadota bacterium]